MSAHYRGAGVGVLLALVGAFAVVAVGLWGVYRYVKADLKKSTAPIRRVDTSAGGG